MRWRRKEKEVEDDPRATFWAWAGYIVLAFTTAMLLFMWTHPDFIPPCHATGSIRGMGGGSCGPLWGSGSHVTPSDIRYALTPQREPPAPVELPERHHPTLREALPAAAPSP